MTYLRVRKNGEFSKLDIAQDVSYRKSGVEQIRSQLKLGSPVIDLSSSRLDVDNGGTLDGVTVTEAPKVTGYKALEFDGVSDGLIVPSVDWPGSVGGMAARVRIAGGGESVTVDPTFKLKPSVSGYKALAANATNSITLNSVTKTPTFWFDGDGASDSAWVGNAGGTWAINSNSGTLPTIDEYTPGIGCKRVKFKGESAALVARFYNAPNSTIGHLGTDDAVFEFILDPLVATTEAIFGAYTSSTNYMALYRTSSSLRFYFGATSPVGPSFTFSAVGDGALHVVILLDRSGNGRIYCNTIDGGATDISSKAAESPASGTTVSLGGYYTATNFSGGISYAAMWQGAGWLDSASQQAFVNERFARACGVYPELAAGTAAPTTMTRASKANLEKLDSTGKTVMVRVGGNWIRSESFVDDDATESAGLLIEGATTNQFTQPEDLTNAAWTKNLCSIGDGTYTGLGGKLFDAIIATTDDDQHYVEDDVTCSTGINCVSVYARASERDFLKISLPDETNVEAYFNLATGAVSNEGVNVLDTFAWGKGDGIWRCGLRYSATGTTQTVRFNACSSAGDDTYVGDGTTEDIHLFGFQHESGQAHPTSYINGTREADELMYPGGDNMGVDYDVSGRVACSLHLPVVTDDITTERKCFSLEDTAGGNLSYLHVATDNTELVIGSGGSSPGIATSATNEAYTGVIEAFEGLWAVDNVILNLNGSELATDTDADDMPASITKIYVGGGGASRINGHIVAFELGLSSSFTPAVLMGGSHTDELSQAVAGPFLGYRYNSATDDYTLLACANYDGEAEIESVGTLEPNTWYFIRFHWDYSTRKIFIDEVEDASETVAGSPSDTPDTWTVGWGVMATDEGSFAEAAIADAILYEEVADGYFAAVEAAGLEADTANLVTELSPRAKDAGVTVSDTEGGYDATASGGTVDGWFAPGTDSTTGYTELGQPIMFSNQVLTLSSTHPAFATDLVTGPDGTFGFDVMSDAYAQAYEERTLGGVLASGKIVILRTSGTSPNGSIWLYDPATDGATEVFSGGEVYSMAAAPDGSQVIVAVERSIGGTRIISSTDGENWSELYSPPGGDTFSSVTHLDVHQTYGVIIGRTTGDANYFEINGTEITGVPFSSIDVVRWYDGLAHVFDGNGVLYSYDGVSTWTNCGHPYTAGSTNDTRDCCVLEFNGELWAGYANGDLYSWNGSAWTSHGDPGDSGGGFPSNPVIVEDKLWVLVKDSTGSKIQVYEWVSGTTWTLVGDTGKTTASNTYGAVGNARVPNEYGAYFIYENGSGSYVVGRALLGGVEQVTPHTVAGWWAINGGSDQVLWCTEEPSTWADKIRERLWFDASEDLVYFELSDDSTAWSISAPVTTNLLTHIAASRSVTEGESTIRIFINGLIVAEDTVADGGGAPGEDILIGAEDTSIQAYQLYGKLNQFRIYDAALSEAQMSALYAAGSAVITAGPYATQAITPTTAVTPLSLDMSGDDGENLDFFGYPMFMYQEVENGPWRAAAVGDVDPTWTFHDFFLDSGIYAFRLYAKAPLGFTDIEAGFDNVDGGEQIADQTILPVTIDKERRAAFERLILQYKPLHSWCVEVVDFE